MLTLFKVIATLSKFIQAPRQEITKIERHGRKIKQRKDKFEWGTSKFRQRSLISELRILNFEHHKLKFDCMLVTFGQHRLIGEQRELKFEWGMVKFRQHCDVGEQRISKISRIWPVCAGLSILRN